MSNARSPITTHVLDTTRGKAAAGIPVLLKFRDSESRGESIWSILKQSVTNADGRIEDLLPPGSPIKPGVYSLTFELADYFEKNGHPSFFPKATIEFRITKPKEHHHVPLLVNPFGYSTYKGT